MLPEIAAQDLSAAIDLAVADLLAKAAIERPPIDVRVLAAALGLTVALDDRLAGRARIVRAVPGRAGRQGSILLRPDPRLERLQWAIAHELGEELAPRLFSELGVDPREAPAAAREELANRFAARLLLPQAWFAAGAAASGWDLNTLKRRFATASHELILRRMLDFPPAVIVSVFDNGRITWRRSNVPGRVPQLSAAERACWDLVHRSGQPAAREAGDCEISAWPVHEPGWIRELMRTHCCEDRREDWD